MVRSSTPVGDGGGSGVGGSAGFHVPLLRGGVAFGLANLRSKLRRVFCRLPNGSDSDHHPVTDFWREIDRLTGYNRSKGLTLQYVED